MSGKNIVFKVECTSPVYGSFRAGDVAHNVDATWAADLIRDGYAAETTKATEDADADAAADAAGRLTKRNWARSGTRKTEHKFKTDDLAAQRAAGVVTTGPTDVTVGAEKTAARVSGQIPVTATPAAAAQAATAAPPAPAAEPASTRKSKPAPPPRTTAAARGTATRTVDKPTKAGAGKAPAAKAAKGKK